MGFYDGALESGSGAARISRRTLARGAAWTAPLAAVAVAAPAYAASRCTVQTNFDDLTPGTTPTVLTFLPSTITASIAYLSTGNGGDNTPGGTGQVAATNTNPSWNYIEVEMLDQLSVGDTVRVTITLSAAVTNLSFKIHDIDTVSGQWLDQVIVNTAGFVPTKGANILGSGSAGDPFRNSTQVDNPINSGLGDVQLTWAGPVSQVVFTYRAGITGNSNNQHIGIGNISFTDCVANPGLVQAKAAGSLVSRGSFSASSAKTALVAGRDN